MNRIIVILVLLMVKESARAQFFHKLGVGMTTGYRFNNTSLYLEGCLKRFALTAEQVINKYQTAGFSFGIGYYHPLHKNTIMPFVGVAWTKYNGGGLSFDWGDSKNSNFSVGSAAYLIPHIGLRCNLIAPIEREKFNRKAIFSAFIRVGYRLLLTKQPDVVFVSGDSYDKGLKRIRTAVKQGIGASIGFAIGFGKKEPK
jgi:hypothetical protein